MRLNNEQQVFLTQEDQEVHMLEQFQTKSGESFDFREGYDTTVYEVHKQYNLRSRRIDVPETNKQEDTKQSDKGKSNTIPVHILSRKNPNPNNPIIDDVSDNQPQNKQSSTSIPPKWNIVEPSEVDLETTSAHNPIPEKEINTKNTTKKENPTVWNARTQIERPFNLEAEVGKLKIAVPLSELAKHDIYRGQISRTLQISVNEDLVNVFDDQLELIFGLEVNGKSVDGGVPPFYVSLNIHDKILHNTMFDFWCFS